VAGARAGVGVAPPDVYDPERIKAALRGGHTRSEQTSRRAGHPGISAPAANGTGLKSPDPGLPADPATSAESWGASTGWDPAPDSGVTAANGNHAAALGTRGPFDATFTSIPGTADPAPTEEFSWLQKSEPEARAAGGDLTRSGQAGTTRSEQAGTAWSEQAGHGRSAETADDSYSWSGQAESTRPADPDSTERVLRHQAEELAAQDRTDFWGQPLPPAPADLRMPTPAPRAEDPANGRVSWPSAAGTTPAAAEPAHRSAAAATAKPLSTAGSPTPAAAGQRERRQDRYFPARLLAVIVIAALIGSALVLLLK
jgi:hypothetical protein